MHNENVVLVGASAYDKCQAQKVKSPWWNYWSAISDLLFSFPLSQSIYKTASSLGRRIYLITAFLWNSESFYSKDKVFFLSNNNMFSQTFQNWNGSTCQVTSFRNLITIYYNIKAHFFELPLYNFMYQKRITSQKKNLLK